MTNATLKPATSPHTLQCISPIDGSVYVERSLQDRATIDRALATAKKSQKDWAQTSLEKRQNIALKALEHLVTHADKIGEEITWQMGRPVSYTANEIRSGVDERVRYLVDIAPKALADVVPEEKDGFKRYIRRAPLGVVAVIAPWNYPFLTAVNAIVPALLAGNAVVLKHSHQTPLVADRLLEAFQAAGLPEGVFQKLDLSHADAEFLMADPRVDHVQFTGSVRGGHAVQQATVKKFISTGLELGGNDPAYVRADASLEDAIANLVDGAFFNSGQCCCGIERLYVHTDIYDSFVEGFADLTRKYVLGNPLEAGTTLGPMVRTAAADETRARIEKAIQDGAKPLIDESLFPQSKPGTPYIAPQVLVNVTHDMAFMREELFAPLVGIMKVSSDEEAIALMNDSVYGLTAGIWTNDLGAAEHIGQQIETGTVFMNRCDYVDPGLCWTGVKNTGKGATLGTVGFEHLTRPKSFHLKK
ncbi:MAG: aldehyde dehydrogenase family protein [Alphaproteobacteria bacterium]|nr:aldehyde dehydrogenase family protein [Alphaproteobacteria bacterium]